MEKKDIVQFKMRFHWFYCPKIKLIFSHGVFWLSRKSLKNMISSNEICNRNLSSGVCQKNFSSHNLLVRLIFIVIAKVNLISKAIPWMAVVSIPEVPILTTKVQMVITGTPNQSTVQLLFRQLQSLKSLKLNLSRFRLFWVVTGWVALW